MIGTYVSILLIGIASVAVGQAVLALCGSERFSWLSPAVGLAALVTAAGILIRLPGHGTTTFVVLVLLTIAALIYARERSVGLGAALPLGLAVAAVALLAASLPFIVNGRTGILGVGVQNDMASHLYFAEWLDSRHGVVPQLWHGGYPLGAHSLAISLARGTGTSLVNAFSGLTLAIPLLTALTVLGALRDLTPVRRFLVAPLVALPYLAAAYFAQGLFKELMQDLFLIAFVIYLAELGRESGTEVSGPLGRRALPLGVLAAGSVYIYGYPGLGWLGGALGVWVVARTVASGPPRIGRLLDSLRTSLPLAAGAIGLLLVVTLPEWGRLVNFSNFTTFSPAGPGLGNLYGPLDPAESLGIWLSSDFRIPPPNPYHTGLLVAVAGAALIYGVFWWTRRRQLAIPSALAASAAIYFGARWFGTVYTSAKALEVAAPLVMLVGLRALLAPAPRTPELRGAALGRAALAAVFITAAAASSFLVLRQGKVGTTVQSSQLAQLRPALDGKKVLFLGRDDFAAYELRGAEIFTPVKTEVESNRDAANVPGRLAKSSAQPFPALDFDSVTSQILDRYDYAITTRTLHGSQPPPNFHLAKQTSEYELWKRQGPTPPRETLIERAASSDNLNCSSPEGLTLSREHGVASVLPHRPYTGTGDHWRLYNSPPDNQPVSQDFNLPAGKWEIAMQYFSAQPVRISAASLHTTLPPALDRDGPFWPVGTISTDGKHAVSITARVDEPPLIGRLLRAHTQPLLGSIAITPVGKEKLIPLSQACGRWVDWYRVTR